MSAETVHTYIEQVIRTGEGDKSMLRNLIPHVRDRVISQAQQARLDSLKRKRAKMPKPRARGDKLPSGKGPRLVS